MTISYAAALRIASPQHRPDYEDDGYPEPDYLTVPLLDSAALTSPLLRFRVGGADVAPIVCPNPTDNRDYGGHWQWLRVGVGGEAHYLLAIQHAFDDAEEPWYVTQLHITVAGGVGSPIAGTDVLAGSGASSSRNAWWRASGLNGGWTVAMPSVTSGVGARLGGGTPPSIYWKTLPGGGVDGCYGVPWGAYSLPYNELLPTPWSWTGGTGDWSYDEETGWSPPNGATWSIPGGWEETDYWANAADAILTIAGGEDLLYWDTYYNA